MVTVPAIAGATAGSIATRGGRASVLELLLPSGTARNWRVLGSDCPPSLQPPGERAGASDRSDEQVDLCIIAPNADECRRRGWLAEAARQAAAMLAPGGMVYILAAPRWRLAVLRSLRRHGLHLEQAFLHQPDWTTSRYLVPLQRQALAFVYGGLIPVRPWRRRLALAATSLVGWRQLAPLLVPWTGLVARRADRRPLFDWLTQAGPIERQGGPVVMGTSWRGEGPVVLYAFTAGDDRPAVIAKTVLGETDTGRQRREADHLRHLGETARTAGAAVPALLGIRDLAGRPVVVETALPGRPASQVLLAMPGKLDLVLTRLAEWLARWHGLSAAPTSLTGAVLEASIDRPAAALAREMADGSAFMAHLAGLCAGAAGLRAPLVATHGDLTMANVLLGPHDSLGVIDWEAAQPAWLPLTDFYYAAVDAVAAASGYADRCAAFRSCFERGGKHAPRVALLARRLGASLDLTPATVDLCFYATWLHHAANEQASSRAGDPRPFRAMLERAVGRAADNDGKELAWQ